MIDPDYDPKFERGPQPSDMEYEQEVASGPVYQNSDVSSAPSPEYDEVILSSGEEVVDDYPEGSYQTWSSRQQEEFEISDAVDAVTHFFSETADIFSGIAEDVPPERNEGYHFVGRR